LRDRQLLSKSGLLIIFMIMMWAVACSKIVDTTGSLPFQVNNYTIRELPYGQRPYTGETLVSLEYQEIYPTDEQGVILFLYKEQGYYHPVNIAQWTLGFLDSYDQTGDPEYLDRAELFAQKLREISIEVKEAIYFPYTFDIPVHGHPVDQMVAPWYSGMAQGQSLSAFVRLYSVTGKREYLKTSENIFQSFLYLREESDPWTAFVDTSGYYWIEEYPMEVPGQVLNGFIFAIYGLYDYYLLTKDIVSRLLLQASITTIQRYISEYRNEGGISYYCLKHKHQDGGYHMIHIDQLYTLYRITGDDYFLEMAHNFEADYP